MYLEKYRSVNHIKHWVRWFHVCPFNCCISKLFTFILKYATEILLDHLIAMINGAQKLTINTQILWNNFFLFCCKLSAVTFSSSIMRLELCQRNFEIGITPEKFAKIDNNRTSNSCHPDIQLGHKIFSWPWKLLANKLVTTLLAAAAPVSSYVWVHPVWCIGATTGHSSQEKAVACKQLSLNLMWHRRDYCPH